MAEEYPGRFQTEVMRSLQKLVEKSIEHDKRFDNVEASLKKIDDDLKIPTNQFGDVGFDGDQGQLSNR